MRVLDNALADSIHGLYTWQLNYPKGSRRGLHDVKVASLTYVDCITHCRLRDEMEPARLHQPGGVRSLQPCTDSG